LDSFKDRIRRKIKENILPPESVPTGVKAQVKIVVLPDGSVMDPVIVKSSGNSAYDDAVVRGILRAQPLPLPDEPELRQELRDLITSFTHEK
jgi:colicin import membrane protein